MYNYGVIFLDSIVGSIVLGLKSMFDPKMIVFLISMLPILELRGGILAASLLGLNWKLALPICIVGNLFPIPFILLFIEKILDKMKNTRFVKLVDKIEQKALKSSESILKYKTLGLFLFVAIPLPGTGAWTGALAAAFLKIPFKNAIISIILGVCCAGIIMSILSYGILGFFM